VSVRATGLKGARFVTAILPADDRRSGRCHFEVSAEDGAGLDARVTGDGPNGPWADRLVWQKDGRMFSLPGLAGTAEAVWTRTSADGLVASFSVCGLKFDGAAGGSQS